MLRGQGVGIRVKGLRYPQSPMSLNWEIRVQGLRFKFQGLRYLAGPKALRYL